MGEPTSPVIGVGAILMEIDFGGVELTLFLVRLTFVHRGHSYFKELPLCMN